MSEPALELPAELQERLDQVVSSVFEHTWDLLASGCSMPTVVEKAVSSTALRAVEAAARRKYAAVAEAARLENERASWMNRLPNELWWQIFEGVPFPDRFAATRLCTRWREGLRAVPRLWTNLHFYASPMKTAGCSRMFMSDILELSKGWPLDVTIDGGMTVWHNASGPLRSLGEKLAPHAPRIVRLRVRSLHTDSPLQLLLGCRTLPALREFVAERIAATEGLKSTGIATSPFCPSGVELPMLQYAHLGLGFTWPELENNFVLPSMRVLDLTPAEDADKEVRAALAGCPRLTTLRLDLCAGDSAFRTVHSRADLALPASLRSITAVSLRCGNGAFITDWDFGRDLPELICEYSCPCRECLALGTNLLVDLICGDPDEQLDIRLGRNDRGLSVRGTSASGRIRSAGFNPCTDPRALLNSLNFLLLFAKCKVKVTVDASLQDYFGVLQSPPLPLPSTVEIMYSVVGGERRTDQGNGVWKRRHLPFMHS